MHIVYAATNCSENVYQQMFSHMTVKPAATTQKYHRLLIEGLAAHTKVDVIASLPVNRSIMQEKWKRLPREQVGNACYHHLTAFRNPVLKLGNMALGSFFKTLFLAKKDSVVIVDCLNRTLALGALLGARIRGCRFVSIITDLPDMFQCSSFYKKVGNFVIRNSDGYILLTEAMNDYLNNKTKPYIVLEGHADITMKEHVPSPDRKHSPRVCLYAGALAKQYGLVELVEGFRKADIPNVQLHLYGSGDYVEELKKIAEEDSRIVFGGMLLSHEIIQKEMEATVLVNPRPTHEEYVKYSFPSKNMEYMSSGTPVLTTVLPGMPKEYVPHVYLIEEETAEGVANALRSVLANSDEVLFQKGQLAREFVLQERNNVIQAEKIIKMLKK